MTKSELFNFHQEIEQMKGSVIFLLLKRNIDDFYKENGTALNMIIADVKKIQEKHMVIEDGKIKLDTDGNPVFKDGMTKEMMNAEWTEALSKPIIFKSPRQLHLVK